MKKNIYLFIVLLLCLPTFVHASGCMEASSDEGVSVVGYLQNQFEYLIDNDENESSFTFNRARMGLVGNIPYDFSYYIMFEFSPYKNGPYLLDGFITYSRLSPYLEISLGQFKSPFSLELNTPCQKLHTINRSNVVTNLANPFRDLGLLIEGKHKDLLKYAFAITNGSGLNEVENNDTKDYAGRVVLSPFSLLSVGGGFSIKTLLPASVGASDPDKLYRYAVELQLEMGEFLVQGEYLMASYESSGGTVHHPADCSGPAWDEVIPAGTTERNGYWAQAMYMTDWNIQPIIKYETYEPNIDFGNDIESIVTFGVNYFFNDWTRLQLNYLYKYEEFEVYNDEILLQLQVVLN
ncbi:MAG: porin [Candidatus Marinimicrobia bacterium]|nr:porin [Candidatus Neomarinimicrobiota bacterium]